HNAPAAYEQGPDRYEIREENAHRPDDGPNDQPGQGGGQELSIGKFDPLFLQGPSGMSFHLQGGFGHYWANLAQKNGFTDPPAPKIGCPGPGVVACTVFQPRPGLFEGQVDEDAPGAHGVDVPGPGTVGILVGHQL